MSAEDYLPDCWEAELYSTDTTDFLGSNPENKTRMLEDQMSDDDINQLMENSMNDREAPYENLKCPDCGGGMASRKGKYGMFWGCLKYPTCRGTRDSEGRSKEERDKEKGKIDESVSEWNEKQRETPINVSFNKKR